MNKGKVLLVDDDKNLLTALRRQLRNDFEVETRASGAEALTLLQSESFPVIVADMQMPHMNGVALLKEVKRLHPDTVRVMLTGNADQATASSALNEGNIFRFVNKPCSQETLVSVLRQAFDHHRLISAEKELLQKTLAGSVKLVTDLLALTAPREFGAVVQRREVIRKVADAIGVTNVWEVELSFMLAPLLTHLVADDLHEKVLQGSALSADEERLLGEAPVGVRRLIENVPRLKGVAELLENISPYEHTPQARTRITRQREMNSGVKIVQILRDITLREQRGESVKHIVDTMLGANSIYDRALVEATGVVLGVSAALPGAGGEVSEDGYEVSLKELCAGQKLLEKIETKDGKLLLSSGTILSGALIERINTYALLVGLRAPIRVDARVPVNN